MSSDASLTTAPPIAPETYWEDRARRFAGRGEGLAAVCSYGMPRFYNRAIQATQRLALAPWLEVEPGTPVLDVGCGVGRWSRHLAHRGARVTGVDLSETMVEEARRRAQAEGVEERCEFRTCDLARLDLGRRFPLVVGVTVLQHILDVEALRSAMARLKDHLEPGGRMVLLEAMPSNRSARCDSRIFTARGCDEYLALYREAGLRTVALTGVDPAPFKILFLPYYRRLPRALANSLLAAVTLAAMPVDLALGRRLVGASWHKVAVLEHAVEESAALVDSRRFGLVAAVVILAGFTLLQRWVAERRPDRATEGRGGDIVVAVGADHGPGSLRDAFFAASRREARARIILDVDEIRIETPLPPLLTPHGVVITTAPGRSVVIDGSGLRRGALLDLRAPRSTVEGVALRSAPGVALRIGARDILLRGLVVESSATGIEAAAAAERMVVEDSRFADNGIGIRLLSNGAGTRLQRLHFSGHREAAIWAVAPEGEAGRRRTLLVEDSSFERDAIALVLGEVSAEIARNDVREADIAGIYIAGRGAVIHGNRIRDSDIGLIAVGSIGAVIRDNEIDHNRSVGVLLNSSGAAAIHENRIHTNGYGLITVFGDAAAPNVIAGNTLLGHQEDGLFIVGASPIVQRNLMRGNRRAGLRVLDYLPRRGDRVAANPLVEDNRAELNGLDDPVTGVYHEPESGGGT